MSEIHALCRKTYQDFIKAQPIPEELKRALRAHERVPAFIDNLAREFSRPGMSIKKEKLIAGVEGMTAWFITLVQRQAEERIMSPMKLSELKRKSEKLREMRNTADKLYQEGSDHVTRTQKGEVIQTQNTIDESTPFGENSNIPDI